MYLFMYLFLCIYVSIFKCLYLSLTKSEMYTMQIASLSLT